MTKNEKKSWAEGGLLEDWGSYMNAKKSKLEDQFRDAAKKEFQDASSLFNGIAIFVNGYTNPCADELKRLMMAHGGIYHHYMRSQITTHIIASNLPYSKIVAYRKSKNPLPICKPEWITDSLKAQKVLDWRPYVLYSNSTVTQPQLLFVDKNSDSTLSTTIERTKQSASAIEDKTETALSRNPSIKIPSKITNNSDVKANSGPMNTKNSEFLSEFYNNSRLHHISTMGATFKDYVNELRGKNSGVFSGLDRLKKLPKSRAPILSNRNQSDSDDDLFESPIVETEKLINEPVIMHIDMDCFFVSVGLRNRPDLKGLPVAVTHAKGNRQISKVATSLINDDSEEEDYGSMSEISSCSYEARKAGLKNGMFLGQALKLCPNLKTIKYDFEGYKEVSYTLYNTVASYTLNIEAVSCDEMYADITSVLKQSQFTPLQFASVIREEIKEKTGCPVSSGFGCNKLQARLATRKAKPDGQFYLDKTKIQDYIGSMIVRDLPGVGSSTMQLLHQMKVHTCSDLQNIALGLLQREFGKKTGEMLHNMCRGVDNSKLNFEHVRKSVSAEVNYGIRFENLNDADEFLRKLSQEVATRLQKANAKGRSLTLKLMIRAKDAPKETIKFMGHGICDNFTKSKNLIAPVDDVTIITKEVLSLWNQMQQLPEDVRGIGIQIARLEISKQRYCTGNMMNFIDKLKEKNSERVQCVPNISSNEAIKSIIDFETPKSNKDEKICLNSFVATESKPKGLKAFLVPKDKIFSKNSNSRSLNEKVSPIIGDIDESVFDQLPADIRMEILKSRGDFRVSGCDDPQPSTSTVPDFVREKILEFSLPSDEASSMENIDESVLNALPEDIRNEILGSKNAETVIKSKEPVKITNNSRQTQQEYFFKHTKSVSGKSGKASMPPIEEIDMAVLIELPEDIRNEIINEYKSKKQEKTSDCVNDEKFTNRETSVNGKMGINRSNVNERIGDEANLSFSQVDPDFLAALSEDMKTDVQMYCMAKKNEKLSKMYKLLETNSNVTNVLTKNRNLLKLSKKNMPLTKSKGNKKTNSVKINPNQRRNAKKSPENARRVESVKSDGIRQQIVNDHQSNGRFLESEFTVDREAGASLKQRQEIISHHSSFTGNKAKSNEHQEMLSNLVNYLFTLPIQQVKMQIQTWISKSDDVNEIDLLSLATFLSMLPKKKRLEDLHILLKTMHRCITRTGSCVWHGTYRRTVYHVQRYMQIEYNSNLMLPRIECDRHGCEN